VTALGWIALLMSVSGVLLNAKKSMWCWPVWFLSNVLWLSYMVPMRTWPMVAEQSVFAALNVYGFIQWRKK
jgi:nicotinamide mononucleotide transporter